MKTTSMDEIRNIAITFVNQPLESRTIGGEVVLVSHPFINQPVGLIPVEDSVDEDGKIYMNFDIGRRELVNVLEEYGEKRYKDFLISSLKKADTPIKIFLMLQRPYRRPFYDQVKEYLSDADLDDCLSFISE